jgi:FAD/FMN-containing dehydrogenase
MIMRLSSALRPAEEVHVGRSDAILTRPVGPRQRETEYAVPLERAAETMHALRDAIEREGLLMNFPCCMRFVRGDDILMSPANRGDSAYISVLLSGSEEEDDRIMQVVQRVLLAHGGRPHWGKELTLDATTARRSYGDNYDRYRTLRDALDPNGMFRNPYLDRLFPPIP